MHSRGLVLISLLSIVTASDPVDEAWQALAANDRNAATEMLEKIMANDKTNLRAGISLSYIYQMQQDYAGAWQVYQSVIPAEAAADPYIFAALVSPKMLNQLNSGNSDIVGFLETSLRRKDIDEGLRTSMIGFLGQYYHVHNSFERACELYRMQGAIIDWQLIGPFDNISACGFDNVYAPELAADYGRVCEGKNGIPVEWFKITEIRPDQWIDCQRYFAHEDAIYYGNTFVYSPVKQPAQIRVGTSGSLKVFLNDELVIEYFDENNNDLDTYIAQTEIQQGWNRLLIKCGHSEIDKCNYFVRVTDERGINLDDIRISSQQQDYIPQPDAPIQMVRNFAELHFEQQIAEFPTRWENYLLLADCYLRNDKAIEAELILRKALAQAADNVLILNSIIEAYLRGEKYDEMNSTIEKIYNLDQGIPFALAYKYREFITNRNYDKAEEVLNLIKAAVPESPAIVLLESGLYSAKEQVDKLLATSRAAYEKFPNDWEIIAMEAGLRYYKTKKYKPAIKLVEKYARDNTSIDVYTALGELYLQASNVKKWEKTMLRLLEFNPAATGLYQNMAETYLTLQQFDRAEQMIRKALEICPGSGLYWAKLGEILRMTNDISGACAAYAQALKLNPTYYSARDILRELNDEPQVFSIFDQVDIDNMLAAAPAAGDYPGQGAVVMREDCRRVVYHQGVSESEQELLVRVFNDDGIDDYKEYWLEFNSYTEDLIIDKAVVIKADRTEVEADRNGSHLVFKTLEENDFIHIKWRKRNFYSGKLSNHFWDTYFINGFYPKADVRYSILLPEDFSFNYYFQNGGLAPVVASTGNGSKIYTWHIQEEEALVSEYKMPDLIDVGKVLYIASIPDWEYMVKWYQDLARTKTRSSYEISELVNRLVSENPPVDTDQKIRLVYDYITENIRYSSVSFRQSGLVPQKARDVLINRIGDCKDKATLAIAMLNELDVAAYYVLVNTKSDGLNRNALPSIVFNHAIIGVDIEQGSRYYDLTAENYPAGSLPEGDADAFALAIKPGVTAPFYLPSSDPVSSVRTRRSQVEFDQSGGATINVDTIRRGRSSAVIRSTYRHKNENERRKSLTESLARDHENVKLLKFELHDLDVLDQQVRYDYSYYLPDYLAQVGGFLMLEIPWSDGLELTRGLAYEEREFPYNYWFYADTIRQMLTINLPEGYQPVELKSPIDYSCPAAEYHMDLAYQAGRLTAQRLLVNKQRLILPEEYGAFKAFYNQAYKQDEIQILLKKD